MPRHLRPDNVHPTQLYVSSDKLREVVEWFDFDEPNYGSLPAFRHEGTWYLFDGHTRALAAVLAGVDELQIGHEEDLRRTYDFEVYRSCIGWCKDEGVTTVRDLIGRVVEPDTFERGWVERCRRASE